MRFLKSPYLTLCLSHFFIISNHSTSSFLFFDGSYSFYFGSFCSLTVALVDCNFECCFFEAFIRCPITRFGFLLILIYFNGVSCWLYYSMSVIDNGLGLMLRFRCVHSQISPVKFSSPLSSLSLDLDSYQNSCSDCICRPLRPSLSIAMSSVSILT